MSQTKNKMSLQPTLYQMQLKYLFFALAVIVYSPGVKPCLEYHDAFTDADNDLKVPPGAEEIQFAYTKPSKHRFHFELGSAGASSTLDSDYYQASRAFTRIPDWTSDGHTTTRGYNWWFSDHSGLMYEDGFGKHQVGKHQSIFFRFNQPQTVVRIAFGTYARYGGASRFSVFASNAEDCLDESQWTVLKVVNDNKMFPGQIWSSKGERVKNLPVIRPFRCYGIQVHQVPSECEKDPATSKLKTKFGGNMVTMLRLKMWKMGYGAAACDVAGKLVPHETDCEKFYVCTGHGSGFPSKCNGGFQFNKNTETCDYPNNVQC